MITNIYRISYEKSNVADENYFFTVHKNRGTIYRSGLLPSKESCVESSTHFLENLTGKTMDSDKWVDSEEIWLVLKTEE